jgi:hypothetical protein
MEELWRIFNNVSRCLEFAEQKNTHLASVLGIGTFISLLLNLTEPFGFKVEISTSFIQFLIGSALCLLLSWGCAIFSFFPKIKIPFQQHISDILLQKGATINTGQIVQLVEQKSNFIQPVGDNLLFFGHIKHYTATEYYQSIKKRYHLRFTTNNKGLAEELCAQIVINSQIATKKYACFKIGFLALLAGIISASCWVFLNLVK